MKARLIIDSQIWYEKIREIESPKNDSRIFFWNECDDRYRA